MESEKLFDLREEKHVDFESIPEMISFLEDIFDRDFRFPAVKGYRDFGRNGGWEVMNLSPSDVKDRLTVENYIEALREVDLLTQSESLSGPQIDSLKGTAFFRDIEQRHYSKIDSSLMSVHLPIGFDSFNLGIYLSEVNDGGKYEAVSKITPNRVIQAVTPYVGPRTEYKRKMC